jgi:YVTN family beta-propeller protein
MGEAVASDGKHLYVTTGRFGAVLIIDTTKDEVEKTIEKVGVRPWGIGISADGTKLYTANGPSNDIAIIDLATTSVKTTVPVGQSPWGIAVKD